MTGNTTAAEQILLDGLQTAPANKLSSLRQFGAGWYFGLDRPKDAKRLLRDELDARISEGEDVRLHFHWDLKFHLGLSMHYSSEDTAECDEAAAMLEQALVDCGLRARIQRAHGGHRQRGPADQAGAR